jgi:Domain of unknown function (DUF6484)
VNDRVELPATAQSTEDDGASALEKLLAAPLETRPDEPARARIEGVVVGTLVAIRELDAPLVVYPGQPGSAALPARATLDIRADHIGREVVLSFENCDPLRPIITGIIQQREAWPLTDRPAQVQVDADRRRLVVNAKDEIVLKCGKASITLTAAGKVMIQGTYVLNRSSGVMRIKGGSVQLN